MEFNSSQTFVIQVSLSCLPKKLVHPIQETYKDLVSKTGLVKTGVPGSQPNFIHVPVPWLETTDLNKLETNFDFHLCCRVPFVS